LRGELAVEDANAGPARLGVQELTPFGYGQTRVVDLLAAPRPELVAGSYSVFWGELPSDSRYVYDDGALRQAGRR